MSYTNCMIQLCVQCPGNDMYVSLWQILMTWWTKDFSDIIFPMDNIICNVLFFGEDLSKIPMNKRRSFLTFGNAKLEPHTVHMLLSYYQDITFNEQSHVPTGCVSIWIKTKYWYCTSKFEAVNANPSASLGGGGTTGRVYHTRAQLASFRFSNTSPLAY